MTAGRRRYPVDLRAVLPWLLIMGGGVLAFAEPVAGAGVWGLGVALQLAVSLGSISWHSILGGRSARDVSGSEASSRQHPFDSAVRVVFDAGRGHRAAPEFEVSAYESARRVLLRLVATTHPHLRQQELSHVVSEGLATFVRDVADERIGLAEATDKLTSVTLESATAHERVELQKSEGHARPEAAVIELIEPQADTAAIFTAMDGLVKDGFSQTVSAAAAWMDLATTRRRPPSPGEVGATMGLSAASVRRELRRFQEYVSATAAEPKGGEPA